MTTPPDELMETVRRELASWHTIHPTATFAEMESAVEAHLHRLRAALLEECTEGTRQEDYPACPHCGARMAPRHHARRMVILPGEAALQVERSYVVCPACGTGLFPPG